MDEKPDLTSVYKLYAGITGFAAIAVTAGLLYANNKDIEEAPHEPAEIMAPIEEGISPRP